MRYIFLTLALINIVYFLYQSGKDSSPSEVRSSQTGSLAPTIRLLGEGEISDSDADIASIIRNPVVSTSSGDQSCQGFGPFSSISDARNALSRLRSLDYDVALRAIDLPTGENDHRVLIPPLSSLEESFRKLRELQGSEIDSYVITQGEDALGISMGVFSTEEAATALRESLALEGYQTVIRGIPQYLREYWIFSSSSRIFPVSEGLLTELGIDEEGLALAGQPCSQR